MKISYLNKFLMVLVPLLCLGCGEPGLDTSNDQAYQESLGVIYEAVPEGERKEFRGNLRAVISEQFRTGALNEKDMYQIYTVITAFGKDKDQEFLTSLNGLTLSQITQQGQEIRKKKKEAQAALHRKKIEDNIKQTKEHIATLEKEVEGDENFAKAPTQIEVIYDGLKTVEGFDSNKKLWGSIHLFVVSVTIKNNSSESIKKILGLATITDEDGKKVGEVTLLNLKPIDSKDDFYVSDLKIGPGTTWQGKVTFEMWGPNKAFPYPPVKEYKATLSKVKPELNRSGRGFSFTSFNKSNVDKLKQAQENLIALEKELASLK